METSEFTFLRSGGWSAILSDCQQKSSNQSMFYGNQGLQGSFSELCTTLNSQPLATTLFLFTDQHVIYRLTKINKGGILIVMAERSH